MKLRTVGYKKIDVQVTTPGQRVPISQERIFVTDFEVYVKSGNAGAAMYLGGKTVDSTWIPRPKGVSYNFTHGDGTFLGCESNLGFDLSRIYMDADGAGDQAIVQYLCGVQED